MSLLGRAALAGRRADVSPDGSLKPSGRVWIDLVFKQWWTNAAGRTTPDGTFAARGFLGDYEVTVTHDGRTRTVKTTLPKEGTALAVTLD